MKKQVRASAMQEKKNQNRKFPTNPFRLPPLIVRRRTQLKPLKAKRDEEYAGEFHSF